MMVYICSGRNQCLKRLAHFLNAGLRKQATGFSDVDYDS